MDDGTTGRRTCPDTGAARLYLCVKGIVRDPTGRVLLLKRTSDTLVDPGKWDLPGGKLDPGELFDDAFRREVREETGLDVAITGIAGAWDWRMPGRNVAYLFIEASSDGCEIALSSEHTDWIWVEPDRATDLDLAPQFARLFKA